MQNLTDYVLASLQNKEGTALKKKFDKLFLKSYIVSDIDHIVDSNVSITEDVENVEEDIDLFKPMEFSKPCSLNDKLNESINIWNNLPDEIVKTML